MFEMKEDALISWRVDPNANVRVDITNANVNKLFKGVAYGVHLFAESQGYEKFFTKTPNDLTSQIESLKGKAVKAPVELSERLSAIKGIGKKSAVKIAAEYKDEDAIMEAIRSGVKLKFGNIVNKALIEAFGV